MRAFVLSGGANLGPIQVGALRALLEHDIFPDMLVGCSAGALNAAFFARKVSLDQVEQLVNVWSDVKTRDVYPEHRLGALWRLCSGQDSFYSNCNFYAFLQRHGATPAQTFGQTASLPLYITTTHLHSGRLHVFGDNPNDRILDAMMASSALAPLLPPWEINGERYIDGGTVTPLPLRVALERGATEIYSLHIISGDPQNPQPVIYRGVASLLTRSVDTMLTLQAQHDLFLTKSERKVRLRHIELRVVNPPASTDFTQFENLIALGYAQTQEFLATFSPQRTPRPTAQLPFAKQPPALFLRRFWLRRFWPQKLRQPKTVLTPQPSLTTTARQPGKGLAKK
jgi:NTE family protein